MERKTILAELIRELLPDEAEQRELALAVLGIFDPETVILLEAARAMAQRLHGHGDRKLKPKPTARRDRGRRESGRKAGSDPVAKPPGRPVGDKKREEVLKLARTGLSDREVGKRLGVRAATVALLVKSASDRGDRKRADSSGLADYRNGISAAKTGPAPDVE